MIAAIRDGRSHPDLTLFRLCREFGWTPQQVREQSASDIERFILILNELERLATLPDDDDTTTIVIED